ncbi:MAG: PilN domain-containing protein [Rhodocyclaceae bacterium]|nr:PilN domain-containing protein [Rhodocyclaceae bacterium]MBK9624262.1 PilN domain-containing protein [Rhodocyclaceae bacterium]MBL0074994.1 PilN domain-containing protein [Rhodocyclaceae bacterium]MBP6108726.1 PilN domain-containing protein [Rhodocyclaceae bacterium]MBP6278859.1 PilN domain-containing protein [Rhodocyclaceae bacterium]
MIRINLLPHREAKRRARRQQFYALLGMVATLAGVIWFLGFSLISAKISAQAEKNDFLKREVASLDKEIAEIKKLKEQTDSLLARKRVIEALQANRTETVHLFNELVRQVPEGIYFKTIKQTGPNILVTGYAQSNARINTLMNNFNDSPLLQNSTLVETKAETVAGRRLNAFSVTVAITRQSTDEGKKGKKP